MLSLLHLWDPGDAALYWGDNSAQCHTPFLIPLAECLEGLDPLQGSKTTEGPLGKALSYTVWFLGGLEQSQGLNSVIRIFPFQLGNNSVILGLLHSYDWCERQKSDVTSSLSYKYGRWKSLSPPGGTAEKQLYVLSGSLLWKTVARS